MMRESCHRFVPCWKKHPTLQSKTLANLKNAVDGLLLIAKILDPNDPACILRK
jgi:hypothetical protein